MAVPKDKTRLTITIHKETKQLMDELLSLHSNMTYSVLVDGRHIVITRGWNGIQNKLLNEYYKLCDEVYQ